MFRDSMHTPSHWNFQTFLPIRMCVCFILVNINSLIRFVFECQFNLFNLSNWIIKVNCIVLGILFSCFPNQFIERKKTEMYTYLAVEHNLLIKILIV